MVENPGRRVPQRASVALAPDGVVVASLPLDRTHLRFFTLDSGKAMFEESGYEVLRHGGVGDPAFPWKFGLLNSLLMGALDDMRHMRMVYACWLAR